MPKKKISIAIPASIVSDIPHLREKTSIIGLIGRTAAIFRISEIIVYLDDLEANQQAETNLIKTILAYMETPQYLRKRLFRIRSELRYVGVLPPLRTLHHPLNNRMKNLRIGEYREGVVLSKSEAHSLVDIGVEKPAIVVNVKLPINRRVTIRVRKVGKRVQAELARREQVPEYWGYVVTAENLSFGRLVETRDFDFTVATSKFGVPFTDVADLLALRLKQTDSILVAFGAPTRGLHDIVRKEGLHLKNIMDSIVNMIPGQGTKTVRTEEALIASMAMLNCVLSY